MDVRGVIEELRSLIDSGTRVPGMRNKVLVDVERMSEIGAQLDESMPVSIQEADEIIRQKDSILSQAQLEAQRIRRATEEEAANVATRAQQEHEEKVGETEIVKAAEVKRQEVTDDAMMEGALMLQETQKNAYRIVSEAEAAAKVRREGADQYAREILFNLEEELSGVIGQVRSGIDMLRTESEARESDNNHVPVA